MANRGEQLSGALGTRGGSNFCMGCGTGSFSLQTTSSSYLVNSLVTACVVI